MFEPWGTLTYDSVITKTVVSKFFFLYMNAAKLYDKKYIKGNCNEFNCYKKKRKV